MTTPFVPSAHQLSFAIWANLDDNAAAYCLWGTAGGGGGFTALLRVETNGLVTFSASTAAAAVSWPAGTAAAPGTWMHYVLTYDIDGGHAILYTNGVSQGSNVYSTAWNGGVFEYALRGAVTNNLKGYVTAPRIWGGGAVLTAGEVKALYRAAVVPRRSDLLLEHTLREGGGLLARDTSGNGNDGTISATVPTWSATLPTAVTLV